MSKKEEVQRLTAEQLFQEEIDALIKAEKNPIPTGWKMSPKSVLTYICGGKVGKKTIVPKYIGNKRLVEIAISTNLLFPIYFGTIVFLPTFPPQIYVNTDFGDIFQPVGIGFFSALIKASISSWNSCSAVSL